MYDTRYEDDTILVVGIGYLDTWNALIAREWARMGERSMKSSRASSVETVHTQIDSFGLPGVVRDTACDGWEYTHHCRCSRIGPWPPPGEKYGYGRGACWRAGRRDDQTQR